MVLTPSWQQATIFYRLEGVTVPPQARTSHRNGQVEPIDVPMEALPIPYSLTDFGRAYLAALRATESVAAAEWFSRRDNGLRRRQQAERHSR